MAGGQPRHAHPTLPVLLLVLLATVPAHGLRLGCQNTRLVPAAAATTEGRASSVPPVVDMRPLLAGVGSAERASAVREIRHACEEWGFFHARNHGLDSSLQAEFTNAMHAFFRLPAERKLAIKRTATNSRGFADDELTKQRRDWKELFDFGHVPDRNLPASHAANVVLDGFNQWPSQDLPDFEQVMMDYFDACENLSVTLTRAIAEALGEDARALDPLFANHTSFLRLNYYPALPEDQGDESTLGISRHTDAGALTVLLQDTVSALEVYSGSKQDNDDGEWVPVAPVDGCLTINVGDMLQVWSNGKFKAPEHRVRTNRVLERFSAPFFFNPSEAAVLKPVVGADEARQYNPIPWGEFRARRFAGDFADVGREIQIEDYRVRS